MTEQREPLACGHEYTGQARCGGCDKCWTCCQCNRQPASGIIQSIKAGIAAVSELAETNQVKPTDKAVITGSTHQHGRVKDIVVCTCGGENRFYRWSWAGHGKAKCQHCKSWIDYRTCEVTK